MTKTKLINFNCPLDLLRKFDETWKRIGRKYPDRTTALVVAMEFFIEENRKKET